MISLMPQYYKKVKLGLKKYEYRRGTFITKPTMAFVYCTVPEKKIGLIIELGQPIYGQENVAQIKEKEDRGSYNYMMDWLKGFRSCCAVPIEGVKTFAEISLDEVKKHFPDFHPPQTYLHLSKKPELLKFLQQRAGIENNG